MAKKSAKSTTRQRKSTARKQSNFWASDAGKKTFIALLCVVAFAGMVAIIKGLPERPGEKYGVGADGFSVFEIKGADLGIVDVVKKPVVEAELGSQAKQVEDVSKSGVVSYDGNKGQTATYYFVTKDGARASVYVDVMEYQSQQAYDDADVFADTIDAGQIQNNPARYMKAVTIANEREYALLVTKGWKSYKFAMTQPFNNVTIDEETAQAILKRIAEKAQM